MAGTKAIDKFMTNAGDPWLEKVRLQIFVGRV